ncbi:MAG: hypothetical protein WC762_04590 [Methylobacter sp.]|jgi:hypothetical protein
MRYNIEKLRRALWTFGQPLTKKPKLAGVPVSDLFVWRNSEDWKTFFELTDIAGLFDDGEGASSRSVTILFFDSNGNQFLEKRLALLHNQRQTVDFSELLVESKSSFGTFCVFHSAPQMISDIGSFITERGYVSYRYKDAPLRSYVHGSLDAISLCESTGLTLLGSSSIFPREYRLQHELSGPALYEVAIVNPSSRNQLIACQVLSARSGASLGVQEVQLRPRGSHVFPVQVEQSQEVRIVINSRLVMARPFIFRIQEQKMVVFHG